jgi:disulfide bond formation protein DsbB
MGGTLLLEQFPLTKALPALFAGSGECASLPFVLGAPLPVWVGLLFCACIGVTAIGMTKSALR